MVFASKAKPAHCAISEKCKTETNVTGINSPIDEIMKVQSDGDTMRHQGSPVKMDSTGERQIGSPMGQVSVNSACT